MQTGDKNTMCAICGRFLALALAILVSGFSVVGCAGSSRGFPEDPREACEFVAMLDKQVYRVGEMAVCKVGVSNRTLEPIVVSPPLSAERPGDANIQFRSLGVGEANVLRRAPVLLVRKPRGEAVRLESFETLVEKFAFTNLTERPGRYRLMVEYRGNPLPDVFPRPESPDIPLPMTRVLEYEVREPRLFERDPAGLILKSEAIRVAREHYGRPVRGARAVLVETRTALLDWWVTLERVPADVVEGQGPFVAYYVSPYGGFVREETEPLTVSPEEHLEGRDGS